MQQICFHPKFRFLSFWQRWLCHIFFMRKELLQIYMCCFTVNAQSREQIRVTFYCSKPFFLFWMVTCWRGAAFHHGTRRLRNRPYVFGTERMAAAWRTRLKYCVALSQLGISANELTGVLRAVKKSQSPLSRRHRGGRDWCTEATDPNKISRTGA